MSAQHSESLSSLASEVITMLGMPLLVRPESCYTLAQQVLNEHGYMMMRNYILRWVVGRYVVEKPIEPYAIHMETENSGVQ